MQVLTSFLVNHQKQLGCSVWFNITPEDILIIMQMLVSGALGESGNIYN